MRRLAVITLVLLVVLGIVGVVADRALHAKAESEVLGAVSQHVALAPGADVTIDGFPFLTQVRAGRLAEVRGSAPEAAFEGLVLTGVRVAARGVSPQPPYMAETVEINADIPLRTLRSLLAEELPLLERVVELDSTDGRLRLSTSVAGLDVAVGLEPTIEDGRIGFELGEALAGADATAGAELLSLLNVAVAELRFDIPGLPDGLVPTRLSVVDDGVRLRLEGTDVTFPAG
ncbi:LmeA family phospholipid-binding protein [Georgenia sunbinii]|uniref:LmeA family phospholipid-binding protein n=1 Tax=Georgenia sunbinii TaxID=3117728 RepID=UPI002F266C5B